MKLAARQWLPIGLLGIAVAIAILIGRLPGSEPGPRAGGMVDPALTPLSENAEANPAAGESPGVSSALSPAAAVSTLAAPAGPEEAPTLKPEYDLDPGVSMFAWRDAFTQRVLDASVADFERNRKRAEAGDADAAYWLHLFYLHCENAPRTEWQLDHRLSSFERYLDELEQRGSSYDPQPYARSLDAAMAGFKRCSFLGPDFDAGLAALEWLGIAADSGHRGAQRTYHTQARLLLTGFWQARMLEQPELIPEFKARADRYAKALLKTGHPQAYVLMAHMLMTGDVYEQDYATAYAYARAAEIIGMDGVRSDAQHALGWIGAGLDPARIADAEKMAFRIVRER